jgi:hypothetical protein
MSGPVVLAPDFSKIKVVGLTRDMAESYAPMNITVSDAEEDGTPKPFVMIIHQLDQDREGLEGCVRNHPSRTTHTGSQGLNRLKATAVPGATLTEPAGTARSE